MSYPMVLKRETPLNAEAVEAFSAPTLARWILRTTRNMALATLDRYSGFPYSTITNLSVDPDGALVFYAAGLSHHSQNIMADPRVSVTLSQSNGRDVLRDRRLTLIGRAELLKGKSFELARNRYRRKFFRASKYLELPDTFLFRLHVMDAHLNGGPARYADGLTADDLHVPLEGAEALIHAEEDLIAHLEKFPSKIRSLQSNIPGVRGRWHIATIDPEGIDLASESEFHRVMFPQRASTPAEVLALLSR